MSYAHTCLPETLIKLGRPHTEKLWSRRRLSFSGGKGRWQGGGEWVKGIIEICQTAEQREKKNKNAKKENEQGSNLEAELWERVVPNAGLGSLLSCKQISILPVAYYL